MTRLLGRLSKIHNVILIGLLVVLAALDYVLLQEQLNINQASSSVLSDVAQQRTLLHRTAFLAQRLVNTPHDEERADLRLRLIDDVQTMRRTHESIVEGSYWRRIQGLYTFFSVPVEAKTLADLNEVYHPYFHNLEAIAGATDAGLANSRDELVQIEHIALSGEVLRVLDVLAEHFAAGAENQVLQLQRFERAILVLMLILLLLSVSVVFRHLYGDVEKLEDLRKSLEERVAQISDIAESRELQLAEKEEDIRRNERFLQSVFENIPYMIFVKDAKDLRFVRWNKAGEELVGFTEEQLIGKNDYDFFPKEEADFFTQKDRDVLEGRMLVDIEQEPLHTPHMGERILHTKKIPILDEHGQAEYLLGISEDITDELEADRARREAEQKERELLERTNRLTSMGMLAAGVAHEVNNPLQGMTSHLNAIKRALPDDFERAESIRMVQRGIDNIAAIVRKLLDLGASNKADEEVARVDESVTTVCDLVESQLAAKNIRLVRSMEDPEAILRIPQRELIQVLLNLIINARDAMVAGGTITVSTGICDVSSMGTITVKDDGPGMSEDVIRNIFTPFFTTKGAKGSGLGLSVAESIVRSVNGVIEVQSTLGQGAVFMLRIPCVGPGSHRSTNP